MLKIVYNNHAQIQKLVLVNANKILLIITGVIIKEVLIKQKREDNRGRYRIFRRGGGGWGWVWVVVGMDISYLNIL